MRVTLTVKDQNAIRDLQRLYRKLGDFRPELRKGQEEYGRHIRTVFATEGAAGGSPWPQLSDMRAGIRESARPGWGLTPILIWDKDLVNVASFQKDYGQKIYSLNTIGRNEMKLELVGAKTAHQEGGKMGKYNLPKRPFWPWGSLEQDMFFKPFEDWANGLGSWLGTGP